MFENECLSTSKKEQDVIDEYSQVLYEKFPCINNNISKY